MNINMHGCNINENIGSFSTNENRNDVLVKGKCSQRFYNFHDGPFKHLAKTKTLSLIMTSMALILQP